jgi:hypothetical protein
MATWSERVPGVVELPDGRRVRGRSLRRSPPSGDELPEFGLYLSADPHEEAGWESRWVCWPDVRLPRSRPEAMAALADAYERAAFSRVEIACAGGIGRTGTALALLARHGGVPAGDAVRWVRARYRRRAVETPWQRWFVAHADLARGDGPPAG